MEADKDQLLHHYFEAVNDLYPPWRGEDILVKVARVVDLKSKTRIVCFKSNLLLSIQMYNTSLLHKYN
jgi:hypothetical protein